MISIGLMKNLERLSKILDGYLELDSTAGSNMANKILFPNNKPDTNRQQDINPRSEDESEDYGMDGQLSIDDTINDYHSDSNKDSDLNQEQSKGNKATRLEIARQRRTTNQIETRLSKNISRKSLQAAIVWSEVLGPPASKKRGQRTNRYK